MTPWFSIAPNERLCWQKLDDNDYVNKEYCDSFGKNTGCVHCNVCPVYSELIKIPLGGGADKDTLFAKSDHFPHRPTTRGKEEVI